MSSSAYVVHANAKQLISPRGKDHNCMLYKNGMCTCKVFIVNMQIYDVLVPVVVVIAQALYCHFNLCGLNWSYITICKVPFNPRRVNGREKHI